MDLRNKVCFITGCDEGVGHGLAVGFLRRGAKVVAGCLRPEKAKPDLKRALCVRMDVTEDAEVVEAVALGIEAYGRVDVLVNNAGIYPRCAADELDMEHWRRVHEINLNGTFRCCQAVIPHFKEQGGGAIVNVGSVTIRTGPPMLAHYASSKAALVGYTRGLARDLGRYGIRANGVHLGAVRTEGELRLFPDQEAVLKDVNAKQSLPGRLTPESVEPVFAFLASEASGDMTGQFLTVDRGWVFE